MNYMKQVAKMLGVELGEKFKIEKNGKVDKSIFYLDERGLWNDSDKDNTNYRATLGSLLLGQFSIEKFQWKPKENDKYYTIVYGNLPYSKVYLTDGFAWKDNSDDYACYATGNCFKTKEEAEAAIPWYKENIERVNRGEKWVVEK